MERKEKIIEIARQVFQQRSEIAIEEIKQEYLVNGNKIRQDLQRAMTELIQIAKRQQVQSGKGTIQYVLISYLYSSAITKSNAFQIALLDERNYLDPVDTSVYWCPDFIYRPVEQDMLCLREAVDKVLIRVKPHELDAARRGYICAFYHAVAGLFFIETAEEAVVNGGIRQLDLHDEVQFLLGDLLDQTILFAAMKKEELQ